MLKCLKSELLLLKTKLHCFDVCSIAHNKKLYRLPYMKNNKSYGFKEIPFYCFKTKIIYNVQRTKLTINRLKIITTPIDVKIEIIESSDCPF
jgi:hypothetical protein